MIFPWAPKLATLIEAVNLQEVSELSPKLGQLWIKMKFEAYRKCARNTVDCC